MDSVPIQEPSGDGGVGTSDGRGHLADDIEREVLESAPDRMKKKAQLLVNRIRNSPHLQWTDTGELVYKGQVVANSNVVDLVNDVLRRRKHFEPQGWQTFARGLKESNVPQDLIGHQERWQWMHQSPPTLASQRESVVQPLETKKQRREVSVPRWSSY